MEPAKENINRTKTVVGRVAMARIVTQRRVEENSGCLMFQRGEKEYIST